MRTMKRLVMVFLSAVAMLGFLLAITSLSFFAARGYGATTFSTSAPTINPLSISTVASGV